MSRNKCALFSEVQAGMPQVEISPQFDVIRCRDRRRRRPICVIPRADVNPPGLWHALEYAMPEAPDGVIVAEQCPTKAWEVSAKDSPADRAALSQSPVDVDGGSGSEMEAIADDEQVLAAFWEVVTDWWEPSLRTARKLARNADEALELRSRVVERVACLPTKRLREISRMAGYLTMTMKNVARTGHRVLGQLADAEQVTDDRIAELDACERTEHLGRLLQRVRWIASPTQARTLEEIAKSDATTPLSGRQRASLHRLRIAAYDAGLHPVA